METENHQARTMPSPQVGDTWAVPILDQEGSHSGLAEVVEVDEPSRTCKVRVQEASPEHQIQTIRLAWLQRNVLVDRKAEVFGPQLQACLFDLKRQVALLQEMADRLCETAPHELVTRQATCPSQGAAQEGTGDD